MPKGGQNFSYLVCVLKQSLDGDAITSMVVCLSQASDNGGETFFSTQYGEKFNKLSAKVKPQKWTSIEKTVKSIQSEMKENQTHIDKIKATGNLTDYYHRRVNRNKQLKDRLDRLNRSNA